MSTLNLDYWFNILTTNLIVYQLVIEYYERSYKYVLINSICTWMGAHTLVLEVEGALSNV